MITRYDEGIRSADLILEELVKVLERTGNGTNTILAVMGDHGEEFLEHGGFSHGHDVHRELAHVPFVVRWPHQPAFRGMPARVTQPVSTASLFPTLADLLHLPTKPEGYFTSLAPLLQGESVVPPVVTEGYPVGGYAVAWRRSETYIRVAWPRLDWSLEATSPAAFTVGFFDASSGAEKPPESSRASEALSAALALRASAGAAGAQGPAEPGLADERLEQLRALGYVK
jgi:arylsulfatase A-like enzyme